MANDAAGDSDSDSGRSERNDRKVARSVADGGAGMMDAVRG